MLQSATHAPNVAGAGSGPTGFIQPTIPYAFAFALGTAPVLDTCIPLGKVVTIAVADGRRAPHALHVQDVFAARVPVIPAVTGPVRVAGVRRGDILEIDLIALEPTATGVIGPLFGTIAVASGDAGRDAFPVQLTIPAGGSVRVIAQQPTGLISFGPVVARRESDGDQCEEPVDARMIVRCTVIQSQGN